jgi:hypothetical protein
MLQEAQQRDEALTVVAELTKGFYVFTALNNAGPLAGIVSQQFLFVCLRAAMHTLVVLLTVAVAITCIQAQFADQGDLETTPIVERWSVSIA